MIDRLDWICNKQVGFGGNINGDDKKFIWFAIWVGGFISSLDMYLCFLLFLKIHADPLAPKRCEKIQC